MNKNLTVGIIGAGRIGKLHTENITYNIPQVKIKTISDIFVDSIKDWAYGLGIKTATPNYEDILNDSEIEAVLICSSTDTHAKFVIESAKASKHIFCEKPLDLNIDKIKEAVLAVETAGVKFQIGFNRRFDHNFKKIRELVQAGKIGEPHIIKITSRDPVPPPIEYLKVSGGIFLDMTIHDFDMVRYILGSEVEEVYVQTSILVDPDIGKVGDVDTAITVLKFENGALGVIDNSRKAVYGYDQRVEVFGSKGCITVSNDTPNSTLLSTEDCVFSEKPLYFFLERYRESFIEEMKSFFNAVLNDEKTVVTLIDALKPVVIGIAAKKSLAEKRPIKISDKDVT